MSSKRDPDDILREEGVDALRDVIDRKLADNARAEHIQPNGHGAHMKPHRSRFVVALFDDLAFVGQGVSMVRGFIPNNAMVVVWGPWKSGKSFWTFDLMMHIACGWSYRGRNVERGTVVYMALEGGFGVRRRAEAWRRQYPDRPANPPFYLMDTPIDLIAEYKQLLADMKAQGVVPQVIVIDTLNRALNGDENQKDMARFIHAVDEIRKALQCTVIVVHHCGHDDTRMRGHSALPGAIDAEIKISRDDVGNVVAKVVLMRDGEPGAEEVSRLEQVTLGYDDDGDPITSCVVVPVGAAVQKGGPKLSGVTALVFRALKEELAEYERTFDAAVYGAKLPDKARCPVVCWRKRFYTSSADDPDTKQKQFVRSVRKLQELRIIEIFDGDVWLTGQAGHDRTK